MLQEIKLSQIADAMGGRLVGEDLCIKGVSTDTRESLSDKLFVALVGERFDGHDFCEYALEQGACAVLVSSSSDLTPRIEVPDTTIAYGVLGNIVRELFQGPVVAITGSNGKTSVKDWLSDVLLQDAQVLKTQSNLNNQVGVPKTLLSLSVDDKFAVIEAGTSFPGEIEKLGQVIAADVVVLTNASGSHLLGFGSIQSIAVEKGNLITTARPNASIVLNGDDPSFRYWLSLLEGRQSYSFSFNDPTATLYLKRIEESSEGSSSVLIFAGKEYQLTLDRPGKHHVANAMAVGLAMVALGFDFANVVNKLSHPSQVPGRMELIVTKSKALMINDCYNASPKSVEAALDVLSLYKGKQKWLALGVLAELGDQEESTHLELGEYAAKCGVQHLITIGPIAGYAAIAFEQCVDSADVYRCQSQKEAIDVLSSLGEENVILVKGSRSAKMEEIVNVLKN